MNKLLLENGTLVFASRILEDGYLYIEGKKIVNIGQGTLKVGEDVIRIDVKGKYISPGFIDMHVHGGGGFDFMDGTIEAFLGVSETHVRFGTTALCPTTLTAEREHIYTVLDVYKEALPLNKKGSTWLGMHLEGPYLALKQCGAQDPRYIRNPDVEEYRNIISYSDHIVRWSAAPELPGALDFGVYLREKGIIPSLAHTDALFEEVVAGYNAGYRLATHFYSAMSTIIRKDAKRYAGAIEAGYYLDDMDVEIIADGIHVPAPLLKLIHKIKGPDHIALVTDAMRAAAMPEGSSVLGRLSDGLAVVVEEGVAKLPDRSAFAGSVATANRLVRNYMRLADVSLTDTVRMMTEVPARILGVDSTKGSLQQHKDADVVVFDTDLEIYLTIVEGDIRYASEKEL
ncbi:N-acetylglucosamine-6-phosphate deacetylase [Sphingobacterium faecale]|uniref:N-acetylglucosamine-6-phosphate deacetylase n=1 Tax=Sphingobacterium faecale TaxID=2803775 RepID=A0ABS1R674_9SPHI|nr:N-acetylglucosamine-6-phosphate deacetylase [Sphingobacterium faecale]MBL1409376.1 N-acetylglucosamine-6-phosphate deacetylase [Sphingobacterium faecale]